MVYGYDTNKEFINKSYQLLEKLDEKSLWNKDTLVIGLDKSVRPLAYALRKLSKEEGRDLPDMRFFNFGYDNFSYETWSEVTENISNCLSANKNYLKKYKDILILDEYTHSGVILSKAEEIIKKILGNEKIPKIHSAVLINSPHAEKDKNLIFMDKKVMDAKVRATYIESGIKDSYQKVKNFQESIPIKSKESRRLFLQNRYQLSKDIKQYMHEKHADRIKEKSKNLENIVSGIFILSFLAGLFLTSGSLTGNIIGNSGTIHKFLGIALIIIGIGGFFIYKKYKR